MSNRFVRLGITGVVTLLFFLLFNYLLVPAWNLRSHGLWFFLLLISGIALLVSYILDCISDEDRINSAIFLVVTVVSLLVLTISALTSWQAFSSESYQNLIQIEKRDDFSTEVPAVSDETPLSIVDIRTAQKLGDRTIGGIPNASWYEVDDEYNLIKYQDEYYRISPLHYGGLFKYNKAKHSGIPGYVIVNVQTQEAQYVTLEKPFVYSPNSYFKHNLKRHLRGQYPSYIFGKSFFEIDDEGNPYWITAVETPTIGLFGGSTVNSFILTDAVNGTSEEYTSETLPEWIDHAYSIDYIMRLVDYNQIYVNGWWNSFTSKTGIYNTTYQYRNASFPGYNTTIDSNGDVVFYTGVTPASRAETNVGFILANPKTGVVTYYECTGAEESSAQDAAESLVKNMQYTATFPTILNIDGVETYLMLLKDTAGLVQRYALCNVRDYTKVVESKTIKEAISLYKQKLIGSTDSPSENQTVEGTIDTLYQAQIDGYTYYYFTLEGSNILYMSSIANSNRQVLLTIGTKVHIEYVTSSEEGVYVVTKIQF